MSILNFDESVMLIGDEIKKSENAYFSLRKKRQRIEMKKDGTAGKLLKKTTKLKSIKSLKL